MKIQTLFSLAAVGLAFAKPIHNLEERGVTADVLKCVGTAVQKGLNDVFDFASGLNNGQEGLDELTTCITNAAAETTDIAVITQNPLQWLLSLDCVLGDGEALDHLQTGAQNVKAFLSDTVNGVAVEIQKCTL
ncbi:hypothetical protein BDV34DRAFT_220597 [Aspergillus parasiticus]|uniref:Hydrophobic surface binding protein A n=1 Tax=Aspergillus parasiticus TaxID=5067 RepID=A0A5N6DZ23_ASPPA|nr:hypothetical protein BDV34DRAFT_220597 [Aspergillus parasiticus]